MANLPSASDSGIYLKPGDFRFFCPAPGRKPPARLHTLLGSCVSIILWHPERTQGGMSHIILPERSIRGAAEVGDGRYCDSAIALFLEEMARTQTKPLQYAVYLVGGGRMYATPGTADDASVGLRNVNAARKCLKTAGFMIRAEHVGLDGYRKVELDLQSGAVSVWFANKRIALSTP